jgi:glyoxylase-like metal-dependent hydrolase (beta-lactamase superfamily II)
MPVSRIFGSITVTALEDGEGPFFEPRSVVFPDATPAQWLEADRRDPASVRDGEWWLRFRCFALRLPSGRVILVDAGIGSASAPARGWAPVPGRLPDHLAAAGIAPDDVDTVVLTHIHADHIGWSMDEAGAPLPQCLIPASAQPRSRPSTPARRASRRGCSSRCGHGPRPVDGGETLAPGVRIMPAPGHTPGHQSVLVSSAEETVVITGTCWSTRCS